MLLVRADAAPFMVSSSATVSKVYMLFHMLRLSQLFVVDGGRLVGMLDRDGLIDAVKAANEAERAGEARPRVESAYS
jgi:CBS domain-containing protein